MPTLDWLGRDGRYRAHSGGRGLLWEGRISAGAGGRAGVECGEGLLDGLQLWLGLIVCGLLLLIICRLCLLLLLTIVWILVAVGILLLRCRIGMGGVGRHDSKRRSLSSWQVPSRVPPNNVGYTPRGTIPPSQAGASPDLLQP